MLLHVPLRPWMKRLAKVLLILLLIFVLVIVSGLAFVEIRRHQTLVLPAPTGPYTVGRMEYDWIDQQRSDRLAPQAGMKRELIVWVWYPAVGVYGTEVAPYLPSKWAQVSDQQHGLLGQQLFSKKNCLSCEILFLSMRSYWSSTGLAPADADCHRTAFKVNYRCIGSLSRRGKEQ
jgi:hypothetical protein